jgi:hypothetical protein
MMKTRTKMDRARFENLRALGICFGIVGLFLGTLIILLVYVQPTETCLEWTENYDLDAEVCWGYGENEREFAPANEELTMTEFEEIVTRFYENR